MFRPGARNLITDVPGIRVGHAADDRVITGVTVLACSSAWAAAVDVRGGGPGTRETDVLSPENLVGRAHAVVLAGGSVFGLAAADGVATALAAAGIGLRMAPGRPVIPIVPAVVLHDLGNGGDKSWGLDPPYNRLGVEALRAAATDFPLGSVGAGRGAMAGVRKGGLGSASIDLGRGLIVGAIAAVNSVGSAVMPDGSTYWAWAFELDGEYGGNPPPAGLPPDMGNPATEDSRLQALGKLHLGANTTLCIVASNAALTTAECKRVAIMAHDGIARAIRPAHTPFDGDTVFALSGGQVVLDDPPARAAALTNIGAAAADCLARAITRGVGYAT